LQLVRQATEPSQLQKLLTATSLRQSLELTRLLAFLTKKIQALVILICHQEQPLNDQHLQLPVCLVSIQHLDLPSIGRDRNGPLTETFLHQQLII